jgi:hypothetical protein
MNDVQVIPEPRVSGLPHVIDHRSQFIHWFSHLTVMDAAVFIGAVFGTQVRLTHTDKHPEHELHTVVAQR